MIHRLKTDLVIMGGGLAGLNAAIAAAERGIRALILDKGKIERSGNIAGGVDHFMAYLESGEEWDTRESYLRFVKEAAPGIVNLKIHEKVFCDELGDAIARLERIGNPLKHPASGDYYRTKSFGQPGPFWINFDGKHLKPKLAKEARRLGCRVLDRVMATRFLLHEGAIAGLTGFHTRTGEIFLIQAKAIIAATGNTNRLFETPNHLPFNTWLCPYDTGDSQTLALQAGAALANMEYLRMTLVPKGFSAPGLNAFAGMDSVFINVLGERFMKRYHPLEDKAPRNTLVYAVLEEVRQGRGPIYIDSRHLPPERIAHLKKTLGLDKETLNDFLSQKGIDIAQTPLEITASEAMQTGPIEVVGSGIKIDEFCQSSVPGLFACGDCADQMKVVHMAVTGGYAAGKSASRYVKERSFLPVAKKAADEEKETLLRPLRRKKGIPYRDVEDALRQVMTEHCGPYRTESGMIEGLKKLEALKPYLLEMKAPTPHELMRSVETRSLLAVGEIMFHAALYRKESRFIPYHYRLDFPQTDDEAWHGQVLVTKERDSLKVEFSTMP